MDETLPASSQPSLYERQFLAALPEIDAVIRFVARRNRLSRAEEDDFAGEVKLAMVRDDYKVLRSHNAQSSLRTFLTTVIHRLFLDLRRREWGKWRPSAAAQRRGPTAVRLEALVHRDGMALAEAIETLRVNHRVPESAEELAALALSLPSRMSRHPLGEEAIDGNLASNTLDADDALEDSAVARRMQAVIDDVFAALPAEDRVLLRLRFESDLSVATIARMMSLDQARSYRQLDRLMARFRNAFESNGLSWPDVQGMIERGRCHLVLPREPGAARPSVLETGP